MPLFLRFPTGGDMLVNADHLISVQLEERIAEQKDVDRAGHLFQVGQTIYFVRLRLPSCNSVDLEYPLAADRDKVYEAINTALQPVVINPDITGLPTPKPPRKTPTRKPRK